MKTYEAFITQEEADKLRNLRIIPKIDSDNGLPFKPSKREIELLRNFKFKIGDCVRPSVDYFHHPRQEENSIFIVDGIDLRTLPYLISNRNNIRNSGPYSGHYSITNINDPQDSYWIKEEDLLRVPEHEIDAMKYNL